MDTDARRFWENVFRDELGHTLGYLSDARIPRAAEKADEALKEWASRWGEPEKVPEAGQQEIPLRRADLDE